MVIYFYSAFDGTANTSTTLPLYVKIIHIAKKRSVNVTCITPKEYATYCMLTPGIMNDNTYREYYQTATRYRHKKTA